MASILPQSLTPVRALLLTLGKRKSGGNDAESAASRARTGESKGGGGGGGGGKTDGPEFSGGRKLTPRDLLIPTALLLALQYFGSQNQGEAKYVGHWSSLFPRSATRLALQQQFWD